MAVIPGWDVTALTGAPRVDAGAGNGKLTPGQTLETDSRSHASLRAEEVGEIDVEPGSRLRLLDLASGKNRLALDRGTIHATIWAPAGEFVIDTPSAVGGRPGMPLYAQGDDAGNGVLHKSLGWVGFNSTDAKHLSRRARPVRRSRRPDRERHTLKDASDSFRAALATLDDERTGAAEHTEALRVVLTQSRKRDALTLWHLLARVPEPERGGVTTD